jgi:hypothetical protein
MSKKNQRPVKETSKPIVNVSPEEPVTETLEPVTETLEPPVNDSLEETINEPRSVRVFWHKSCRNVKESTLTTLRPEESLTLTDSSLTDPEGNVKAIYSLKRGKRIYYLIDVTPQDCVKASLIKKERDELKERQRIEREALKEKK